MSYHDQSENEIAAFDAFERKYGAMYPAPRPPSRLTVNGSWQFWLYIVICSAAVLLAGLRTAEMFYRAAAFTNVALAWAEAILAVFTVEVSIVAYSASLSEKTARISKVGLYFGLLILGSISVVAGFGQAMRLIDNIDPVIVEITQYTLAILVGPGASLAALLAGHILGLQIKSVKVVNHEDISIYQGEVDAWRKGLITHWKRSPEFKALKDGITYLPPTPIEEARTASIQSRVGQYLQEHGLRADDPDISPVEIARTLGVANPGSVRTALYRFREGIAE